ncbi:hypothetical protein DSO57_1035396 [Entomophthora muscae]|uniref:Uncharacterized protein n=1 Tax=Entomophthora muscae TaxID=34485 RepID=A0ACC2SZI5_9FUNG|nr:hypothetical protein DSO57_1035396 [Entomophthora muscae]
MRFLDGSFDMGIVRNRRNLCQEDRAPFDSQGFLGLIAKPIRKYSIGGGLIVHGFIQYPAVWLQKIFLSGDVKVFCQGSILGTVQNPDRAKIGLNYVFQMNLSPGQGFG